MKDSVNRKGSILMICLWILAILVIFAISLGNRAVINLRLARYQRDRLKAYCLAKAGINKAKVLLNEDENDPDTGDYDTVEECGVNLGDKKPEEIFSQNWNNKIDGFNIGYKDYSGGFVYGLRDEESKININRADETSRQQLTEFFILNDINLDEAAALSDNIFDWIDEDNIACSDASAENKIFKNEPLTTPEELLIILEYFYQSKQEINFKDKAQEVYNKIKDLITVYPDNVNNVNVNTVPEHILSIFADITAENDDQRNCAAYVAGNIIKLRNDQEDGYFKNVEDIKIDVTGCPSADILLSNLKGKFILKSDYFKIESTGYVNNVTKKIAAIYNRKDKKNVYWHQN